MADDFKVSDLAEQNKSIETNTSITHDHADSLVELNRKVLIAAMKNRAHVKEIKYAVVLHIYNCIYRFT